PVPSWPVDLGSHCSDMLTRRPAYPLAITADGSTAAVGVNSAIRPWDTRTGKELPPGGGHSQVVRSLRYSPDGQLLSSPGHDQSNRVWDTATGKELWNIFVWVEGQTLFSPDSKTVAVLNTVPIDDAILSLREAMTGKVIREFTGAFEPVGFSPDGKRLVTGTAEGNLRMWDVASGKALRTLRAINLPATWTVAFSTDAWWEDRLAGSARHHFKAPAVKGCVGRPFHGALSPDGRTLALWLAFIPKGSEEFDPRVEMKFGAIILWEV